MVRKAKPIRKGKASQNGKPQKVAAVRVKPDEPIQDAITRVTRGVSMQKAEARVRHIMSQRLKESIPEGFHKAAGSPARGRKLTTDIQNLMEMRAMGGRGKQIQKIVAAVFVEQMMNGEFPFFKEYMDRTEGKPIQAFREESVKVYVGLDLEGDEAP